LSYPADSLRRVESTVQPGYPNYPSYLSYAAGAYGSAYRAGSDPYSPYGSSYSESPTAGFLHASAAVISSTGRFLLDVQHANLLREQVQQAKIDTRLRVFDQWLYERDKTPTIERERQRYLREATNRSLNDPPSTEIWSASALNTVLADIQKNLARDNTSSRLPHVDLEEEVLRHVNLMSQKGDGHTALLRNDGRLNWPLSLRGTEFKADRELLDRLAPDAIKQALAGRVDAGTLRDIVAAANRISNTLGLNIKDLPSPQYMEARRFLNSLDATIKVLRRPDARDYFTKNFAARGKNVAELVKHITENGLRFAPAVDGDEAAYIALHRALVTFYAGTCPRGAKER
jgi:hypothetical protein